MVISSDDELVHERHRFSVRGRIRFGVLCLSRSPRQRAC